MQPGYTRHLYYPDPALRRFITSYCILTPSIQGVSSIPWHIMPDGAAYILFHVYEEQGGESLSSRLAFVGPRSTYVFTDRKRRVLSLIAQLKPGTAFLPQPYPLFELKDRSCLLDSLLSLDLDKVSEELRVLAVAMRIPQLVQRFDQLMLTLMDMQREQPILANAAVTAIDEAKGQLSLNVISENLGVSDRHLRSVFKKTVGLSPKRYARIVRLTETVRAVDKGFAHGWAQLAITSGYYDQSHMIDDFQELVGESTDAFISRLNREDVLMPTSDFSNT